jgi:hypothetical protein
VAINSELQAIRTLRQFIKDGGLTITTEFAFKNQNKIGFRTSIQLDGCIINFFPDLTHFSTFEDQQLLENYLKQHQEKIKFFFNEINRLGLFLQQMFYLFFTINAFITSFMVDIHNELGRLHPFLVYLYEIHPYLVSLFWFMIGGTIGSLIFYYIVLPFIWYLIIKKVRKNFDF